MLVNILKYYDWKIESVTSIQRLGAKNPIYDRRLQDINFNRMMENSLKLVITKTLSIQVQTRSSIYPRKWILGRSHNLL